VSVNWEDAYRLCRKHHTSLPEPVTEQHRTALKRRACGKLIIVLYYSVLRYVIWLVYKALLSCSGVAPYGGLRDDMPTVTCEILSCSISNIERQNNILACIWTVLSITLSVDFWFDLWSFFLVEIPSVYLQFLFRSSLESFPVWSEEGSCLHGMALKWPSMCWCAVKKLLTHSLTHACMDTKIAFLGKWDERGERPFLWLLTSFPDRHTYFVHSVQYRQ